MNKIVALGELLIDFTQSGLSKQGNELLEVNPGGAPCNVLAMLQKLGDQTAFIGKVGNDAFGKMLRNRVSELGINTTYLYSDDQVHTTLAFVHTMEDGDRDFSFYRNPGADMMLSESEIPEEFIATQDVFHFGTLSMTHDGVRAATKKAVEAAKKAGCLISFDPNLRPPLWDDLSLCKEQMEYGFSNCDILKISDNEIVWFTGEEDYDLGIAKLQKTYHIPCIVLSMGRDGSRAYFHGNRIEVPAFIQKDTVETTGAGDTFGACILHFVSKIGLDHLTCDDLQKMLTFANAAASIVTTRRGALCVMPSIEEVEALVQSR